MLRALRKHRGTDPRFSSEALPDVHTSQWWSEDRIAEYQAERVRLIVEYAYEETGFYRRRMRRLGVRPSSIQGPDDLPALPTVDRAALQQHHDRVIVPRMVHEPALSGGTTGHRLRWARTVPWLELFTACLYRGFGWAGVTRRTRLVSFYSRMGLVSDENLVLEGTFDTSRVEEEIREIRAYEPEAAYVYASAAHFLARFLLGTGRTLPLRTVITSCDMLYPEYRPIIEEAFGCRVFDNYGCNDGGGWGAECSERDGLHHDVERAVVEFVDGKMVTTDLWNTAFPFIRYENGDAGAWVQGACACGRSLPRFRIFGRTSDLLVTPTRVIFPSVLNFTLLNDIFADARVVQRSDRHVDVLLVKSDVFNPDDFLTVKDDLGGLFEGMELSFRFVDAIPRSLSGKHRVGVNLSAVRPGDLLAADGPGGAGGGSAPVAAEDPP